MAFTLKKHTSNQLESARLNDVNQNWTDIETAIDALQTNASLSRGTLVATTAAGMTQTDCIYVYTGSETGYTAGNWYYYNGSAWVSGGVYFSATIDGTIITDTDNSTSYRMQFRLVGGKPVIEYNQV
jgi:hypothetical protein